MPDQPLSARSDEDRLYGAGLWEDSAGKWWLTVGEGADTVEEYVGHLGGGAAVGRDQGEPVTARFDCTDALWRDVGDESTPHEKALWHAVDALREIDEGGPHVNHVQHVAARGLEAIERALRGFSEGPSR